MRPSEVGSRILHTDSVFTGESREVMRGYCVRTPFQFTLVIIMSLVLVTACGKVPEQGVSPSPPQAATATPPLLTAQPTAGPTAAPTLAPKPTQESFPTPTAEPDKLTAVQWYATLVDAGYGDASRVIYPLLEKAWENTEGPAPFRWLVRKLDVRIDILPFMAAKYLESGENIENVEAFFVHAFNNYESVFCTAYMTMTEEEKQVVYRHYGAASTYNWSDIMLLLTDCASTFAPSSSSLTKIQSPVPEAMKLTAAQWYVLLDRAEYGEDDAFRLMHNLLAEGWDMSPASPRFKWLVRNLNPRIGLLPTIAAEYLENGYVIWEVERFYAYTLKHFETVFCDAYLMMNEEERSIIDLYKSANIGSFSLDCREIYLSRLTPEEKRLLLLNEVLQDELTQLRLHLLRWANDGVTIPEDQLPALAVLFERYSLGYEIPTKEWLDNLRKDLTRIDDVAPPP